jgi:small GTP-binding protein
MSRWRIVVVAFLLLLPVAALAGVGSYYLWRENLWFWVWWPLAGCLVAGYLLAWFWQRSQKLLRPVDSIPPVHWTDRDRQAWHLVEARAKAASKLTAEQLSDINFYIATAREMALELARFYHPNTQDPVGPLTVPEMLAVVELVSHDLAEMVDQYLPGGHLLSVNDWKRARQAYDWYQTGNNVVWAISALFSPINTALRYTASRLGMSGPLQMLQQNLLVWFYTAYVNRLGTYLIDLNSGRLRVGATRYRELLLEEASARARRQAPADGQPAAAAPEEEVKRVTVTLLGQVKAGKSSLINALLGEQRARTDVLPATDEIARYELRQPGIETRLVLLDTTGYAHAGPKADQVRATQQAAQQSDLLLLVLHARNPARAADVQMLEQLQSWFTTHPDLKRPPILAVLTHIDLLSPAMEWSPPYNWQQPQRPKEQQIREALETARQQFGPALAGVVPVRTDAGKVYGIEEWLLPAVAELLDEVHAVALLRCLRAEIDTGKIRKVFRQLAAAGKQLVTAVWETALRGQR